MTLHDGTSDKYPPVAARQPHPRRTAVFLSLALLIPLLGLFCPPSVCSQIVAKERGGAIAVNDRVAIEMYGGYLKGQSRELVYEPSTGHKNSELFWTIDDAYVVGGTVSVRANDWLTLRVGGWTPMKSHNTMNDYDWALNGHGDWSDLSHHPDTRINHAAMIDAGAKGRVATFGKTKVFDQASLDLLAGFRWLNISWTAYGGSGIYSINGFRNQNIKFDEGLGGLAYEQWYNMPYVGLGGSISKGRFTLAAELTGSFWGWGSSKDQHYDRTFVSEEQYSKIAMAAGDFSLAYALSKNFDIVGRFVYTKYFESQSPLTILDYKTGLTDYSPGNASGMDHQNMLFSLGVRWRIF